MQVHRAAGYVAVPEGAPNQYREHLRVDDLSVSVVFAPAERSRE